MQKPLTGALLGVLVGVSTAIFLARQGIWPNRPADPVLLAWNLGPFGRSPTFDGPSGTYSGHTRHRAADPGSDARMGRLRLR